MVTKDRRNERKEELAFIMTLQAHLAAKVSSGDLQSFADLQHAQERISSWFSTRAKDVLLHASIKEADENEKTLIFLIFLIMRKSKKAGKGPSTQKPRR